MNTRKAMEKCIALLKCKYTGFPFLSEPGSIKWACKGNFVDPQSYIHVSKL